MNSNGPVTERLPESNQKMQDERKEIRDGVSGEGQGRSKEDESQIIESAEFIDGQQLEAAQDKVHTPDAFQRSQKQCQGPLIHRERFLPLRSLKVLLVENDDSTRHVVSALLRNCGYEVTAVENGLQAWKILEDLTMHMDLVLAEVVLPSLSGIGLLCKIMGHKTCKNIPVIMMSSYDSMNIVFKCLSKGAVEFLAKPIRKNELKNLWQHVWRKCHSSSDGGSENGIHSRKSTKLRSGESDNNTGSNDEDDIGSIDLNVWDGSDNGSDTQTSWTKRAVEVESPLPVSAWEQLADPPDSTCAQVILSRPEAFGNNRVPVITPRGVVGQDNELDLEMGIPRIPTLQLDEPRANGLTNIPGTNAEKNSEINSKKDEEKLKRGQLEVDCQKPNDDLRNQAGDLIGLTTKAANPQRKSLVFDIPNGLSKEADIKNEVILDYKEMPSLEFSSKRMRDVGDTETSARDRNVLRHSDLSAFSRYNATSMTHQASVGNFDSCSPHDNSLEAAKTDSLQNFQSTSKSSRSDQHSNGSRNNNDKVSTTNNVFTKQVAFSDKPTLNSTVRCLHSSSAFQPGQNCHICSPQSMIKGKTDATVACTILAQTRDINQQIQVQYHHHHHHVHNMSQQQIAIHDDLSLKNTVTKAPQHGSSSTLSAPLEGSACSRSLNGSASGSNNRCNGQNGTTDLNARVTNIESGNGVAGKGRLSGVIGGVTSRSGVDADLVALREAALNKFRQKRKQRCFEKKVRYQSRKQVAEQRPRFRGQFVRQVVHRKESKDAHC